ncbi:MAG: methylated-DNA--[protein]-cysteine S-methyltransferase [Lachnospiraceae bacterium]|nr:methylated-DNA--[protein]-cysteine S-methyltransferase [Lachnospiraceae bacterium]
MKTDAYAVYPFPFGFLKIGYDGGVITCLKKMDEMETEGKRTELTDTVYGQMTEYLQGRRKTFDFPYELRGTEFQKKVWEELCRIPYGETRTYKEIAAAIHNPGACRAVGMANNRNPMMIVVPCHRVIGTGGKLVGYGCGLEMKAALLQLEQRTAAGELPYLDNVDFPVEKFSDL